MAARKPAPRQKTLPVPEANDSSFRRDAVHARADELGTSAADYARKAILFRMHMEDKGFDPDALPNAVENILGIRE